MWNGRVQSRGLVDDVRCSVEVGTVVGAEPPGRQAGHCSRNGRRICGFEGIFALKSLLEQGNAVESTEC
uniref:Uncharacterized protein n=1 Tax=Bursaphelenchus xylophilus TaxID=6326 RepID=A0A1I7RWE5_BURXY